MKDRDDRSGVGPAEVLVILAIVVVVMLLVLMALPRQREVGRTVGCRRNLMQIGKALAIYDTVADRLPVVDAESGRPSGPSPFVRMMLVLGRPDFSDVDDPRKSQPGRPLDEVVERTIPGLLCGSDPATARSAFPAPVSYRAVTGSRPDGSDGPFALGRPLRLSDIQSAAGAGYTAAFTERLIGDGRDGPLDRRRYAVVQGEVDALGCVSASGTGRGNAGSSWLPASWTDTLITFTTRPGTVPSCVSTSERTAAMAASSGHVEGTHVLMCDGSVRQYTDRVNPEIWAELADFRPADARPVTPAK